MRAKGTAWFDRNNPSVRRARLFFAYFLTSLLCFAAHGVPAPLAAVVPATLLGGTEEERASDESGRETVSKLHRLGFTCHRDGQGQSDTLPTPANHPPRTALDQPHSLVVHRLGSGIACRC